VRLLFGLRISVHVSTHCKWITLLSAAEAGAVGACDIAHLNRGWDLMRLCSDGAGGPVCTTRAYAFTLSLA